MTERLAPDITHSNRAARSDGGWVSPFVVLGVVLFALNAVGAPIGLYVDRDGFQQYMRGLRDQEVMRAYLWTVYACLASGALYFLLGIHRQVREYQERPMSAYTEEGYRSFWFMTFVGGIIASGLLFVQAGFRVPLLDALGADYYTFSVLRTEYTQAINQVFFNVTLYWLVTANIVVAWFHMRGDHVAYRALSVALLFVVGTFTLARSPLALAFMIVLNYRLLSWKVPWRPLLTAVASMLVVMYAVHAVAGTPGGHKSMTHYLGSRIFYGQWASVPYYFSMFERHPAPLSAVLPPFLQDGPEGGLETTPARMVMRTIAPGAIEEGGAGVASGFFIGEAYAVAGELGVLLAPVLVMGQVWLIVRCFQSLGKTTLNMFLFSWFLFKVLMGMIVGFSAFLFSSLQAMVVLLLYWVLLSRVLSAAGAQPRPHKSRSLAAGSSE